MSDDRKQVSEAIRHLKMTRIETAIVCQSHAQISCADDADAMDDIEAENLAQVPSQFAHVVSHAANTELSEISEVLSNLG